MAAESNVRRFVKKSEDNYPWFGTREDLLRIAQVAGECYDLQKAHYRDWVKSRKVADPYADQILENMRIDAVLYEGEDKLTGPAADVVELVDPRRMTKLAFSGTEMSEALFGSSATLEIALTKNGLEFYVASSDLNWATQTFGRIYDEARKGRHPRWATWKSTRLRNVVSLLAGTCSIAVVALVIVALHSFVPTPALWIGGFALLVFGGIALQNYAGKIPVAEILPEGVKPQMGGFIQAMFITVPLTLISGVVVNLATR
jgi:hypothetical protein